MSDGRYPCRVCGAPAAPVAVWLDTALGVCCWWTCAACEDQAAGLEREQPAHRIPRPPTREERQAAARTEVGDEPAHASSSPHPAEE